MRTREEIEREADEGVPTPIHLALIQLEVLLDIRDILIGELRQ